MEIQIFPGASNTYTLYEDDGITSLYKQGYFLNNEGKCISCYENQIRSKNNNCITCDDIEEGGIEGGTNSFLEDC